MLLILQNSIRALLPVLLVGGLLATGCKKQEIRCTTAHGAYAVRFNKVEGNCPGAELTAGVIGVQSYIRPNGSSSISYEKVPVALKAEEVGELVAEYEQAVDATKLYSLGAFTEEIAGSDGYCNVTIDSQSDIALAMKPASTDAMGMMHPALPAVSVRYEWSNVKFWVNPAMPGTQFTADLSYTRNSCTTKYTVQALYPAASCGKASTNAMGAKIMVPDVALCSACSDPANRRVAGSGISPDIETVCDDDSMLCLPAKPIPSLRAAPERCSLTSVVEPWPEPGPEPARDAATESRPADTNGSDASSTGDVSTPADARDTNGEAPRG